MPGKIEGAIVAITPAGQLVTDIPSDRLHHVPRSEQTAVRCDEHETFGIFPTAHGQPPATFVAFLHETGKLALEVVGEDASMMLGIRVGDKVVVEW